MKPWITRVLIGWAWCWTLMPAQAQEHPDLGAYVNYPIASEVWMGSIVGLVQVNPRIPIELSVPGDFHWKVANGEQVVEGQPLGLTDAKKVELSQRNLELKKRRFRNSLADLEASNREQRKTLQASIRDLEENLSKLELTEGEKNVLGAGFEKRLVAQRAELERELTISRNKLESDYYKVSEEADRQALDLDIEQAEHEHEALVRASDFLAEDSGKLVIQYQDGMIRKPTLVGEIIKEGLAEVRIELADPRLRTIPGKELLVEIGSEDGRTYRGRYLRELEEKSYNRNARILVFEVQKIAAAEPVPETLSGSRLTRVFRLLPKPGRLIPKNDFVFKYPKEISEEGWAAFIEKRWPSVRVTYVAPKVVVVNAQHEN